MNKLVSILASLLFLSACGGTDGSGEWSGATETPPGAAQGEGSAAVRPTEPPSARQPELDPAAAQGAASGAPSTADADANGADRRVDNASVADLPIRPTASKRRHTDPGFAAEAMREGSP